MNCPDFETLMLMLDGELRGEELKAVSEHLKSCSKCRRIVDSQRKIESSWRDSLNVPDRDRFSSMEQKIFNKTNHNRWWKACIPAVAGIIAVLLGVKLIVNNQPNPDRITDLSGRYNTGTSGIEMEEAESMYSDTPDSETVECVLSDTATETLRSNVARGGGTAEELSQQSPSSVEEIEDTEEAVILGSTQLPGTDRRTDADKSICVTSGFEDIQLSAMPPDEPDRVSEQSCESHSSFDEVLNENTAGEAVFVELSFNADGFPDSITASLLDSLVAGWIDYIPFVYRDTVLLVPPADVQNLLTGENAVPPETME